MLIKRIIKSLTVMTFMFMTVGAVSAQSGHDANYHDYGKMVEDATGKLRDYFKANPGYSTDTLRSEVMATLTDGAVAKASDLTAPRKKKLTAAQVYDIARRSSLIYGKMEHNEAFQADSAYKTASAVVLTPDGICATNYHVVADVVLSGALGRRDKNDLARFVMDCEGNVFPVTSILAVDPINDYALIKVDPCGQKLAPASVGDDIPMGTPVYCLASPSNTHFSFTEGIASNATQSMNKRTGNTRYILDITADYGVGASGGPIFDENGNLVALVSATLSLYAQPEQFRNFQMAYKQTVPVFLIKERFK